jgi:hypothetical protein
MSAAPVSSIHHRTLTCRSSTGHASARLNSAPALRSTPRPSRLRPLLVIKQTALDSAAAVIIRAPTPIPIAATFIPTKSP